MDEYQFYPTPPTLIAKMWACFKNKKITRLLDPSAGDGRLLFPPEAFYEEQYFDESRRFRIARHSEYYHRDACEIDMAKHPLIREKKVNIVSLDFMDMKEGALYSHIIMNPPFAKGADHVIHAWDILYEGEIVALVNAETLRNPCSRKREQLLKIIADNAGTVEYLQGAFTSEEADRKTEVDVAIIYLEKKARGHHDFLDSVISSLHSSDPEPFDDVIIGQALAIPTDAIQNAVKAFNAAWAASKEAIILSRRVNHYKKALGKTLAQMNNNQSEPFDITREKDLHDAFAAEYDELKDRGWSYVLRSTEVSRITSSQVQAQLERDFEEVKKLDFTLSNIFGFLQGLALSKGQIQIDMALGVFDSITKFHSENRVFYMGWKSNDKHRTAAMRIKMRRFVLPGFGIESWQHDLNYDARQKLMDMDKVFAMLDGKAEPEFGLIDAFNHHLSDLRDGKRLSTSYFDLRYYPGIGTIHFFPNQAKIVDRLNIMVGKARNWIPEDMSKASSAFVKQYDDAEKINKNIRLSNSQVFALSNEYTDHDRRQKANDEVMQKLMAEMEKLGYQTNMTLSHDSETSVDSPCDQPQDVPLITHEVRVEGEISENSTEEANKERDDFDLFADIFDFV